jgi:hypothetical protein
MTAPPRTAPPSWGSVLSFTRRHGAKVHRLLLSIASDHRRARFATLYGWMLDQPSTERRRDFWTALQRGADALNEFTDLETETLFVLVDDGWEGDLDALLHAARAL